MTASQRIQPAALLQLAGAVVMPGGTWPVTRHAPLLSAAWLDEAMAPGWCWAGWRWQRCRAEV